MEQKRKATGKELVMVATVIILAFALTVIGIVYIAKIFLDNEPTINHSKLEPVPENTNVVKFVAEDTLQTDPSRDGEATQPASTAQTTPATDTNTKPAATVTDTKPVTTKPAATVTDTKPVTTTKPAATVTDTKPVTTTKPVATVTDTKPVTTTKPAATVSAAPTKTKYQLQLFAFQKQATAEKEAIKYQPACADIYIVKVDLGDKGIWYRVRGCGTDSKEQAVKYKEDLKSKYGVSADLIMNY